MSRLAKNRKIRINPWDWLLIVGLVLAPMTGLRIWKIGPAELLCFIWGLRFITHRITNGNFIQRFFVVFFSAMFLGTVIGRVIAPRELIITDWFTWIFLAFIALTIYEGLSRNSLEYNEKILDIFCFISVLWYLFLYIYSIRVSRSFLGAPLWYSGARYTGGAQNPHQVAVLMCGIIFCFVRNFAMGKRPLLNLLFVGIAVYVVFQTASSTGVLSIVMGAISAVMVLSFYRVKSPSKRMLILILELILGILFIVFTYPILIKFFYNWLASDTNGLGRIELFSHIGTTFKRSPLFGLGPGTHSLWGSAMKEFHNSYLEILACSGLMGSIAFVLLTVRSVKKLTADPAFIPVLVAIYGYSLAGFAFRKLSYWGVYMLIIVVSEGIANRMNNDEVFDETL